MTTSPIHTITDEQIAEIESLVSDFQDCHLSNGVIGSSVLAIITRLRESEKDAARYRWLRNDALSMPDWAPAVVITEGSLIQQCLEGRDLDEEIDTAMQGEQ